MKNKAIPTAKKAFEIGNITKIMQGRHGIVRVDAVVRDYNKYPDMDKFYSDWITVKYANSLCRKHYGKKVSEMRVYSY